MSDLTDGLVGAIRAYLPTQGWMEGFDGEWLSRDGKYQLYTATLVARSPSEAACEMMQLHAASTALGERA